MPVRKKKSSARVKRGDTDSKDGKSKRKTGKGSAKKGDTTKDSASEKVDAAANELRQNDAHYDHFLQRMDLWLRINSTKVLTVMKRFDRDQESFVTYDEFKSALFDIDAPCNVVELHLLCKVLDISGDKDIDYTMLHEGLYNITGSEDGALSEVKPDNKSLASTLSIHPPEPEVTHLVQWLGSKKTYTPDTPR